MSTPFVSLTQARASRDRFAACVKHALSDTCVSDDAEEMVENICCAGEGHVADSQRISKALLKHEQGEGEEALRELLRVVDWIRTEERRQLKAALGK